MVLLALLAASDLSRGVEMYQARQFEAAEAEFRKVLVNHPRDAAARLYLARTLIEVGRAPEALEEIDRVLAGNRDPETQFQAGRILRELAEERLSALQRAAPNSAPVHDLTGRHLERQGKFPEALGEYRAALALEPRRPGTHYLAGSVLWKMRELAAAEKELRAELVMNPHHGLANLRLGQVLMSREEDKQAALHLERAVEAMPDSMEARRELGKAYRNAGRPQEARRAWEAVAAALPDDDQIHYLLGTLYKELGEAALAARELEKHRQILRRRRELSEKRERPSR